MVQWFLTAVGCPAMFVKPMLITRRTVLPTVQSIRLILNFMNYLRAIHSRFVRSQKNPYKWYNTKYIIILYLIINNYCHIIEYIRHNRKKK